MNIVHLYKDYYPVIGGIENHIKVLAEAQVAGGHCVAVLVCDPRRWTRTETINGVPVIKAGREATVASMPLSLAQPLSLARMRPDVLHIHSPYPLGEISNRVFGKARVTVLTHHSDVVRQKKWLYLYGPFLRGILRSVDRIIATSPPYIESSPWLRPVREKCAAIPLGVDTAVFKPSVRRPTEGGLRLLFVGRLRYYKGLDTLLGALARVPQARLTVVGDGPMRKSWENLSLDLGLGERVVFAGEVSDDELPACYHAADLFVLPANARSEAFGTVLLEAMASGLPCIATELGTGTSWIVQNGTTGFVVPPANPDAMARAVKMLVADPERGQAMGKAGRRRVEERFAVERMICSIESLYQEALVRKGIRPNP
jgi:rhamnosyl/mannosyltransferase